MKVREIGISLLLTLTVNVSFSQLRYVDFTEIDRRVQRIDAATPDPLAYRLAAPYKTDLEKVRAIFQWIAGHIEYRTKSSSRKLVFEVEEAVLDTAADLRLFNYRAAQRVLNRRVTVCEGYARLFKTLCDYAGVRSEIISGYARSDRNRIGRRFGTNHTWNAVYVDSAWHLLDVTWASGYTTYWGDVFIRQYNDDYFLTPPEIFVQDHFPEDPRWTLLTNPPTLQEFHHTPFKPGAFVKYKIQAFHPVKGIIEAAVGDSIYFELQTTDAEKHLRVAAAPVADTAGSYFAPVPTVSQPLKDPTRVGFTYAITSDAVQWLDVFYNGEMIMRYKLNVKKEKKPTLAVADYAVEKRKSSF